MKYALASAAFALSIALASSVASATVPALSARLQAAATSGDVMQQRKDVDLTTRTPPPSGPTSQTAVCNPSLPDC